MAISRPSAITAEAAESLAIQALAFLAVEPERLGRFLATTGIGPEGIRSAARDPQFLAGLLDYLVGDEKLLIEFANHIALDPVDVARACSALVSGSRKRDVT